MPAYRKASIWELTSAAYELDGRTVQGVLHRGEDGRWMIGSKSLESWLSRNEGENAVLILLSLDNDSPMERKVCQGCGREYVGVECPHCRDVRRRLRRR